MNSKYITYADVFQDIQALYMDDILAEGKLTVPWDDSIMPDNLLVDASGNPLPVNAETKQLAKDIVIKAIVAKLGKGKTLYPNGEHHDINFKELAFDNQVEVIDKEPLLKSKLNKLR